VYDLAIDILPPRSVDDVGKEEPGDEKEVGHAERQCEGDNLVQPTFASDYGFDAERRMHHHDKDDAKAFGVVDPVNPTVVDLSAVHDMRATSRRIGFDLQSSNSIAALATRYRLCY
jgi:hypothetical protein